VRAGYTPQEEVPVYVPRFIRVSVLQDQNPAPMSLHLPLLYFHMPCRRLSAFRSARQQHQVGRQETLAPQDKNREHTNPLHPEHQTIFLAILKVRHALPNHPGHPCEGGDLS